MLFNISSKTRYGIYLFISCFFSSMSAMEKKFVPATINQTETITDKTQKELKSLFCKQKEKMEAVFEILKNYVEGQRTCYLLCTHPTYMNDAIENTLINNELLAALRSAKLPTSSLQLMKGIRSSIAERSQTIELSDLSELDELASMSDPLITIKLVDLTSIKSANSDAPTKIAQILLTYLEKLPSINKHYAEIQVNQEVLPSNQQPRRRIIAPTTPAELQPSFTQDQVIKLDKKLKAMYPRSEHIGCIEYYPPDKDGRIVQLGGMHAIKISDTKETKASKSKFVMLCQDFLKDPSSAEITELYKIENKNSPFELGCARIRYQDLTKISSCFFLGENQNNVFWSFIHECILACLRCDSMRRLPGINGDRLIPEDLRGFKEYQAHLISENTAYDGQGAKKSYELQQRYICQCFDNLAVCLVFSITLQSNKQNFAEVTSVKLQTLFPLVPKCTIKLGNTVTESSYINHCTKKPGTKNPEIDLKKIITGAIESLANYIYKSLEDLAKDNTTTVTTWGDRQVSDSSPDVIERDLNVMIRDFSEQEKGLVYFTGKFREVYEDKQAKLQDWLHHSILTIAHVPNFLPNGDNSIVYLNENGSELTLMYLNEDDGYYAIIIPIYDVNKLLHQAIAFNVIKKAPYGTNLQLADTTENITDFYKSLTGDTDKKSNQQKKK